MRRRTRLLTLAVVGALLAGLLAAAAPGRTRAAGGMFVEVTDDAVVVGNDLVTRTWSRVPFGVTSSVDRRTGLTTDASPGFRLHLAGGTILSGSDFAVTNVAHEAADDHLEVVLTLASPAGDPAGTVTRTVTVFPDVAGVEIDTTVALPVAITGYTLEEIVLPGAAATVHHFNAGYDWRGADTPEWAPALAPFGGAHTGDHRVTTSGAPGEPVETRGQWLSLSTDAGPGSDAGGETADARAFAVTQRVNYDSTRMAYDGQAGRAEVDLAHDVAYLGPFEADVHLANPTPAPFRARVASPGTPLDLETVFSGFATDADDEPWQHHRYLAGHRAPDYDRAVVFNSNGVDENRISTGAKDDMDLAEVERQAAVARRLGVETFVLDDGWQARSGDWCPDSPECPEPRDDYPPRFPDDHFGAVRDVLGDDMELGLWMTPMHFHPSSNAYADNPEWACTPTGDALAVYNTADPESSSNEAGLGTWNPLAVSEDGRLVDYIEGRIRRAIEEYGARYFKFDFLVWLDCVDAAPADAYHYREAFVALLDRLIADYPGVTFQVDETNDYRLFPFESVARGPVWYANGHPAANEALHNLWVLAPYVPGYAIGQAPLGDRGDLSVGYLMAAALNSHLTFFSDLTDLTDAQVDTAAAWTDLYKRHRDRFATFTYPLLEDPISGDNWTGLQPFDVAAQTGALLVFRQDSPQDTRTVALRGIRGKGAYRLTDAVTGEAVGTFAAHELRSGIEVLLPSRHSAAVYLVDPLGPARAGPTAPNEHPTPH